MLLRVSPVCRFCQHRCCPPLHKTLVYLRNVAKRHPHAARTWQVPRSPLGRPYRELLQGASSVAPHARHLSRWVVRAPSPAQGRFTPYQKCTSAGRTALPVSMRFVAVVIGTRMSLLPAGIETSSVVRAHLLPNRSRSGALALQNQRGDRTFARDRPSHYGCRGMVCCTRGTGLRATVIEHTRGTGPRATVIGGCRGRASRSYERASPFCRSAGACPPQGH